MFTINEDNEAVKTIRGSFKSSTVKGDKLLSKAARYAADKNGEVLGANLGLMLRKMDPSFSPAKYGFKNLTEFIEHFPNILIYEGQKSGGDRKYKLVATNS